MAKPVDKRADATRKRAERRLAERLTREVSDLPLAAPDAAALVHELQVHQIELEMQNEELVKAHAEVDAARARYVDLYDFAPVGYFTVSADSTIGELNLTAARILGVERTGLIARRLAIFLAEGDRVAFAAALNNALVTRTPQEHGAHLAPTADLTRPSTYLQMTISASPAGDTLRVVAVDATERKRAEKQLQTSQKLEAIGLLAGGVAHDFNNLLTVILSSAAVALDGLPDPDPTRDLLDDMNRAARRAADLTRQLLSFSRQKAMAPRIVDVNALVTDAAVMLRRLIREDVRLVLSLADNLAPVLVDPTQLDQVIVNLAVNARDAMPSGGTLTLATANVELHRGPGDDGGGARTASYVRLTVSDTGTGISAATMEHLFEPFFTTKHVGLGTGLGLSTVFGIVRASGGTVVVRSEPGAGAAFEIDFPRAAPAAAARLPVRPARPAVVRGTETILVVEDEPALLHIALRVLGAAGYAALGAASGEEALALAEGHRGTIHLALSDVIMPGMSGLTFARQLAAMHPEARVLFMSGYTADVLTSGGDPAAATFALLEKPFTPDELQRKVREVLDGGEGRSG